MGVVRLASLAITSPSAASFALKKIGAIDRAWPEEWNIKL